MDNVLISIVDVVNDFKLYVNDKRNKLKLKKVPKEGFINHKIDKLKFKKRQEEFNEELSRFAMVLKSNFKKEDLENFRKNMRTLQVYGVYFQLGDFGLHFNYNTFMGRYDVLKNAVAIDLSKDKEKSSIYHELFHMASTRRGMILTGSGFHYHKTDKVSYGRGLNEGYTDLLTQRYFYNKDYEVYYESELIYASLLERIIGKEKMESLYLNGDLNGLIHELEKYDTLDNIFHFIKEIDYIKYSDGIPVDTIRVRSISHFLIQAYMRKKLLNGESIYDNETGKDVYNFIRSVPTTVEVGGNKIKVDLRDTIDMIVNDTFPQEKFEHYR